MAITTRTTGFASVNFAASNPGMLFLRSVLLSNTKLSSRRAGDSACDDVCRHLSGYHSTAVTDILAHIWLTISKAPLEKTSGRWPMNMPKMANCSSLTAYGTLPTGFASC